MASSTTVVPGLLSVPRITTLVASLIVSLGSGSNYVRGFTLAVWNNTYNETCGQVYSGDNGLVLR